MNGKEFTQADHDLFDTPIHDWFGLTYCSYLTIPRTILQSMPIEWQRRFVKCLEEAEDMFGDQNNLDYTVNAREGRRFVKDPLINYERGRRRLVPTPPHPKS